MLDSEVEATVAREAPPPAGLAPRRRLRGRRGFVLGGTAVLVVGAAGAVYALQGGGGSSPKANTNLPTVPVTRTDLVNTRNMDGTLGFAGSYTVLGAGGRITWLPAVGAEIRRGRRVYGVNGHNVPLFYGSMPFWRDLSDGMTKGRDVLQLERNLDALGYGDGMTVDRTFTYATTLAIMELQKDLHVTQSGTLKMDAVVVQPGPIRVTKLNAVPGSNAGGVVLTASGTERVATVKLPVSEQAIARKGAKVRITLPGGKTATGRISSVGTVAVAGATNAQSQTGQGTENATIPIQVTLDKGGSVGDLDASPVTVGFASTEHKGVLAVPIRALLASSDGAYSVNVVDAAGAVRSVPVKLGIFDGDNVEVSGALTEGTKVQVPRS